MTLTSVVALVRPVDFVLCHLGTFGEVTHLTLSGWAQVMGFGALWLACFLRVSPHCRYLVRLSGSYHAEGQMGVPRGPWGPEVSHPLPLLAQVQPWISSELLGLSGGNS